MTANTKPEAVADLRCEERIGTNQLVEVHWDGKVAIAQLLDISNSGAKLEFPAGTMPPAGAALTLVHLDGNKSDCVIKWNDKRKAGTEFSVPFMDVTEFLYFDHLGNEHYIGIAKMQKSWKGSK